MIAENKISRYYYYKRKKIKYKFDKANSENLLGLNIKNT